MDTTLLLDADILVYRMALANQDETEWAPGLTSTTTDLTEAKDLFSAFVRKVQEDLKADRILVALSDSHRSFRRELYSKYKANRPQARPALYAEMRRWLIEEKSATVLDRLEGDDVLGLWATQPSLSDGLRIMCSVDKDLRTVPGRNYNWDRPELGVETVSEHEANLFFLSQVLTGDRVDNYPGCPGIGPVRAAKALEWIEDDQYVEAWERVCTAYQRKGQTEADALINARCAWILRHGDYNYTTKEVNLWTISRLAR